MFEPNNKEIYNILQTFLICKNISMKLKSIYRLIVLKMILKIEFLLEFNGESLIILLGLLIKVFNEICAIS